MVGKREALELVLAGILAGGHVLIEDLPGLGKTLAARSFAQTLGLDFTRAQFTPDLLPADLTGSFIYDQKEGDFSFRAGPLFTGLLLADEINRTPPKTQAALLEAMQERQVTVEGQTFVLDPPFHVIATANPVEYEGTYPLPEAQLDRFLLRVTFGYPTSDQEWGVLERRLARQREEQVLDAVTHGEGLRAMQSAVETVTVEESVGRYCVALAAATRDHPQVLMGASPRGRSASAPARRAYAVIRGRDGPLGQVFRNLIDNARSFSPAGGVVRVSLSRDDIDPDRPVRVRVEDDGPGIPPENLETVFERFYTSRPAGAAFGTNSGLGLSIVKQIVEAHGGRVWAENRQDADGRVAGARFEVALPAAGGRRL